MSISKIVPLTNVGLLSAAIERAHMTAGSRTALRPMTSVNKGR